jgi:SAM-dependent methyltransferase
MEHLIPSQDELTALFQRLHGDPLRLGWRVRMHARFGYFPSQSWYEGTVNSVAKAGCRMVDVGGGKALLPHNRRLSRELADRCSLLVGVDPSAGVLENDFVHQRFQGRIEDFHSEEKFDVATLRMVAEHLENPTEVVAALARLMSANGLLIVFTPNRWSPVSIAASIIPNSLHGYFTRVLWGTAAEDTFPTLYRMNTRRRLRIVCESAGFREVAFARLADCSTLERFPPTCFAELCLWRILWQMRLPYPQHDLLGIYRRL